MSKKEQLKELIWYIATNYPKRLGMTKLWKLCFFAESDFFEKFDQTITDVKYIKNNLGPTPDWKIAEKALKELIGEGLLSKNGDIFVGVGNLELKFLDPKKVQSIENTCSKYSELSPNQLVFLSHQDPAYLMSDHNTPIDFMNVHYRSDEVDSFEEEEKLSLSAKQKQGLMALASI